MSPNDTGSDSEPQINTAAEWLRLSPAGSAPWPAPSRLPTPGWRAPARPFYVIGSPFPPTFAWGGRLKERGVIGGGILPHHFPLLIRSSLPLWKSSVDSYWPAPLVFCPEGKTVELMDKCVYASKGKKWRRKRQGGVPPKCIHMDIFGKYQQVFQVLFNVFVLLFHVPKDVWS